MEGIVPTMDINRDNCCNNNNGWGNGWGAAIGGFAGAALGNGWNGGWNRNGVGPAAFGETFIMDSLSGARSDINAIGRDQLMQSASAQNTMCQGFGGVNASVERVGASMAQGQSRMEAAVLTTGLTGQVEAKNNTIAGLAAQHAAEVQSLRNTYDLKSSIDSCCCNTQRGIDAVKFTIAQEECATRGAIHEEGEKTRALMAQLDRERLLREMGAKDAKIAALEAQAFNSGLAANAAQQNRADLNSAVNTLLGHMALLKSTTGTTTGTTPAA